MTLQWTRTASAAALLLLSGGCFTEVSPDATDDDDGGTTSQAPSSGDPPSGTSASTTAPEGTSGSSGDPLPTTGSTSMSPDTSGGYDDSTSGGPMPSRIDFYSRACTDDTLWASHRGDTACDRSANGEVVQIDTKGPFKRVISTRPPTDRGLVTMQGNFSGLSLADVPGGVLSGQAACPADEKCETALTIRLRNPVTKVEELHAGMLSGDRPFDFVIPLHTISSGPLEVSLESSTVVSPLDGSGPSAVLWVDVHIAAG